MAVAYSEPQYDIRWDSHLSIDEDAHPFRVGLRYMRTASDDPSIHDLIGDLYIDGGVPDNRATWHRNYTRLAPWLGSATLQKSVIYCRVNSHRPTIGRSNYLIYVLNDALCVVSRE